ncbi:unnamed protein product [Boreogadus saida]
MNHNETFCDLLQIHRGNRNNTRDKHATVGGGQSHETSSGTDTVSLGDRQGEASVSPEQPLLPELPRRTGAVMEELPLQGQWRMSHIFSHRQQSLPKTACSGTKKCVQHK